MTNILSLFSKSPFEPLYKHRVKVNECVDQLKPLFDALFTGDSEKQELISKRIFDLESEADIIKAEVRIIIPKGVFLPVNREDLMRYLKLQDNLADTMEDISLIVGLKIIKAPTKLADEIMSFIETVLTVCTIGYEATKNLTSLAASGFKGEEVEKVLAMVEKSEKAERESDRVGLALARSLFTFEDEMKPTDLFLWFRIFDLIGDLADDSDNTTSWLRIMLAR